MLPQDIILTEFYWKEEIEHDQFLLKNVKSIEYKSFLTFLSRNSAKIAHSKFWCKN